MYHIESEEKIHTKMSSKKNHRGVHYLFLYTSHILGSRDILCQLTQIIKYNFQNVNLLLVCV